MSRLGGKKLVIYQTLQAKESDQYFLDFLPDWPFYRQPR
jgi:hypothetical protein